MWHWRSNSHEKIIYKAIPLNARFNFLCQLLGRRSQLLLTDLFFDSLSAEFYFWHSTIALKSSTSQNPEKRKSSHWRGGVCLPLKWAREENEENEKSLFVSLDGVEMTVSRKWTEIPIFFNLDFHMFRTPKVLSLKLWYYSAQNIKWSCCCWKILKKEFWMFL